MNEYQNPIFIFDLDGTLANIEHRLFLLKDRDDPDRWRRFYAMCDQDKPIKPVITTMERLKWTGAEILIFTGRSEEVRSKTVNWLVEYTTFNSWNLGKSKLFMRPVGDHRPDTELKQEWLNSLAISDRERIIAAFEDRDRVVQMWRDNGIQCYQVAPGEF